MSNFIKNLLKPNDWIPVWHKSRTTPYDETVYNKHTGVTMNENRIEITCSYTIEYSKSRNEYRQKCIGYEYQRWPEYSELCNELNKLINKN